MLGSVGLRPLDLSSMFACLCNSQSTESQRNLAWKDSQCPRGPSIKTVSHRAFVGPICIDCGQWAAPKIKSSRNLVQNDHCLSDNSGVSGRVNRHNFHNFLSRFLHSSLKVFQSYAGASTEINVFRMQTNLPGAPKLVSCAVNHWTNTQGPNRLMEMGGWKLSIRRLEKMAGRTCGQERSCVGSSLVYVIGHACREWCIFCRTSAVSQQ